MIPLLPIAGIVGGMSGLAQRLLPSTKPSQTAVAPFIHELRQGVRPSPLDPANEAVTSLSQVDLQHIGLEGQRSLLTSWTGRNLEVKDVFGKTYQGRLEGVIPFSQGLALNLGGHQIPISNIQHLQIHP